jgi:hypothetical protein
MILAAPFFRTAPLEISAALLALGRLISIPLVISAATLLVKLEVGRPVPEFSSQD